MLNLFSSSFLSHLDIYIYLFHSFPWIALYKDWFIPSICFSLISHSVNSLFWHFTSDNFLNYCTSGIQNLINKISTKRKNTLQKFLQFAYQQGNLLDIATRMLWKKPPTNYPLVFSGLKQVICSHSSAGQLGWLCFILILFPGPVN